MADHKSGTARQEQVSPHGVAASAHQPATAASGTTERPNRLRVTRRAFAERAKQSTTWSSWWWWEIGGAVLALVCFFSTIAVLRFINGKILEDWKLKIEPPSLLSTLITIGKLGLTLVLGSCVSQLKWSHFQKPNSLSHLDVLDEVSRAGPWSIATMLIKIRGGMLKRGPEFMIALFALITLWSFAIDPMIQMALTQEEDDYRLQNLTAYVLTNQHYDALAHDSKAAVETMNRPQADGTQLILHESSFFNQLASTTLRPDVTCPDPGTRCEFRNITMLGLCSEFSNVTDQVERVCTSVNSKSMDCDHRLRDISTYRKLSINFGLGGGWDYEHFRSILEVFPDDIPTMSEYKNKRFDVARLFTVKVTGEVTDSDFLTDRSLHAPDTQVTMTNWYWCKRSYESLTTNGRSDNISIAGEVKAEALQVTDPGPVDAAHNYHYATKEEWDAFHTEGSSLTYPTMTYSTNFVREDLRTLFGIVDTKWRQHFDSAANGQLQPRVWTAAKDASGEYEDYRDDTIGMASFMVNANMSELAERMAIAVTNQVQQRVHNRFADVSNGTVHEKTAYYRVTWGWLALPLLLPVAATVLLFFTILFNDLPLLKTSGIGVLAHGPENAVDYRVDGMETVGKWGKFGDGVNVMLLKDEKGWTRLTPV